MAQQSRLHMASVEENDKKIRGNIGDILIEYGKILPNSFERFD